MNKKGIIMFTKDRPEALSKSLSQLTNVDMPVIVLDDSTNPEATKLIVNNFAKKENNIYYHGRFEQKKILQKVSNLISDLDYFIKPLGKNGWNLGYVRNYAIIISKALNFEQVIFMDDDIIIKDKDVFSKLIKKLDNVDFVGAKIIGMSDNSLVEHIMIACGEKINDLTSGGFLAFNLNKVSEYFLNHYNEDQIWLYLHSIKSKIETFGEVEQLKFDPFEEATKKALSQQFGEILRDGVVEASKQNDFTLLLNGPFWYEILIMQIDYIKRLKELCKGTNVELIAMDVYNILMEYHSNICPDIFVKVFIEYFNIINIKDRWKYILDKLNAKISLSETDKEFSLKNVEV